MRCGDNSSVAAHDAMHHAPYNPGTTCESGLSVVGSSMLLPKRGSQDMAASAVKASSPGGWCCWNPKSHKLEGSERWQRGEIRSLFETWLLGGYCDKPGVRWRIADDRQTPSDDYCHPCPFPEYLPFPRKRGYERSQPVPYDKPGVVSHEEKPIDSMLFGPFALECWQRDTQEERVGYNGLEWVGGSTS